MSGVIFEKQPQFLAGVIMPIPSGGLVEQDKLSSVRQEYACRANRFLDFLESEGSEQANLEADRTGDIISSLNNNAEAHDLLYSLLAHDSEAARYTAAADLLSRETLPEAIDVLRELARNPVGFIAPTARFLPVRKKISLA
ncbi:hypothetical protein [Ralstonia solanacearum]|uniref:Uncharacterized protein n=1 Tax=Ralstonia solanacearum TaxID=305 RepID=A0AAE3NP97_RALSL|nr:hypothetical protein [Ralstonia solanacearum]MBB6580642.1 hypothetical protein [Ralstonia solanacearum]MDB0524031.1 hypothetical protein [Ralstonia solanacearum]